MADSIEIKCKKCGKPWIPPIFGCPECEAREQGSEIDFLREALFFWSQHKDICQVWESPKATCNCGLQKICDKALAYIDAANKGEK